MGTEPQQPGEEPGDGSARRAPLATSIVDAEGRFLWVDDATCRLVATSRQRLLAGRLGAFLDIDDVRAELLAMHGLTGNGAHYELEQRWRLADGTSRRVLVRGSILAAPAPAPSPFVRQVVELSGERVGGAGADGSRANRTWPATGGDLGGEIHQHRFITSDAQARRELQAAHRGLQDAQKARAAFEVRAEQLERSNRDLTDFAYMAAHDLRAPLTALGGAADLLVRRSGAALNEESQRYLAAILGQVGTMGRMISDLLDYCRTGSGDEKREEVDCNEVIAEVLGYLAPEIAEAEAHVIVNLLPSVEGERTQLHQLFQNLVSNALKYRRPEGRARVEVKAEEIGPELVFSVTDAGIGVPAEQRDEIFQMFRRLPNEREKGTGIGLAICKRIVDRHGGRIWVDPTSGGGLCFCFTLPPVPGPR